jgi:hypothetical protein
MKVLAIKSLVACLSTGAIARILFMKSLVACLSIGATYLGS